MEFDNRHKAIDTSSFTKNKSRAYMSMSPKGLPYAFNSNRPNQNANYSTQYHLPPYISNNTGSRLIKPAAYTTISSPNRHETSNNNNSFLYNPQIRNESSLNTKKAGSLISSENNLVITSNQILNRSNCDLKNRIITLNQELASYKESNATVKELKEYTDYLNSELSRTNNENKELSSHYESIAFNLSQITEENSKLNEMVDELRQQHQLSLNSNEELKANYIEVSQKLDSDTDHANLVLREKDKRITQLTNSLNDLTEKNDNLNKTLKDYDELNMTMKKTIDILSQNSRSLNAQDLKDSLQAKEEQINAANERIMSIMEEKKRLSRECYEKDIIIGSKQKEIEGKEQLNAGVIDRLKEEQEVFKKKINSLYEIIGNRDHTIEELKSSYSTLNNALIKMSDGGEVGRDRGHQKREHQYRSEQEHQINQYKDKYELEVMTLEESKNISKGLIDSREQMEKNYEEIINTLQKTLDQVSKRYSNVEEVFHENEALRSQNELLMKQMKEFREVNNQISNANDKVGLQANHLQPDGKDNKEEEILTEEQDHQLNEGRKEQIAQSNNSYALYNICKKKLIAYDFSKKTFRVINPQNYDLFLNNYQEEGSITYNTLEGLFALTGPNFDMVYYYHQKKNSISQILQLKNNHCNGSVIMDDATESLIFLSGNKNALVDLFNFKTSQLSSLPSMRQARANASYCFINRRLYAFFGYDYQSNRIANTIEFIDMSVCRNWESIDYSSRDNSNFACAYHLVVNIGENEVLLLGGLQANEEKFNQKIITMNMERKTIEETETDLPSIQENKFYLFDSNSQYNIILQENANSFCMVAMDNMNNVHVIDNELRYEVIVFAQGVSGSTK